jgi:hypothetical protein
MDTWEMRKIGDNRGIVYRDKDHWEVTPYGLVDNYRQFEKPAGYVHPCTKMYDVTNIETVILTTAKQSEIYSMLGFNGPTWER